MLLAAATSGCGAASWRKELFALDAVNAPYPVMLSTAAPTPPAQAGRPISGLSVDNSSDSSDGGYWRTYKSEWSTLPAWQQILSQVNGEETWVQIDKLTYRACDEMVFSSSSTERSLTVEARGYR